MDVRSLMLIMMSAILVNNYVLSQFLGICPFLGVSKDFKGAAGMGVSVLFVMLLSTAATWPIQTFLLDKNGLGYLQTVVFILVIAALVQLVEFITKRYMKALYITLGVYLPLITTNCAILAVTLANVGNGWGFAQSMVSALGAGLGFLLAMVIFSGIREQTKTADPPPSFVGIPLTLCSAAILSLAFFGFGGVIENLFG